jgi:hypothetical protein
MIPPAMSMEREPDVSEGSVRLSGEREIVLPRHTKTRERASTLAGSTLG